MARVPTTPIFVPSVFGGGVTVCEVVACRRRQDENVVRGEVLVELRGGRVRATVESPLTGTISQLYLRQGETAHVGEMLAEIVEQEPARQGPRGTSESGNRLVAHSPALLALTLAAGALAWPLAWLLVTLVVAVVVGALASARIGRLAGPADLVVIPLQIVLGAVRWVVTRPLRIPLVLASAVGCALIAIAVPALVGGVVWLLSHGGDGLGSASRLAVAAYSGRLFALIVCLLLLRRMLCAGAATRAIRAAAERLPEPALTAATVLALGWIVLCAAVIPRDAWWPYNDYDSLVAHLPDGLGVRVREARADLTRGEAEAVTTCLAEHGRGGWRAPRLFVREDGSLLIGIRANPNERLGPRRVSTLLLALNNQLAPLRDVTVSIVPGRGVAPVELVPLPARRPTVDFAAVGAPAANERDLKIALACSAAAL